MMDIESLSDEELDVMHERYERSQQCATSKSWVAISLIELKRSN